MQMEMESDAIIRIMRVMDSSWGRLVRERARKEGARGVSSHCVQVNCTEPSARVHGPNVVRDRRSNCGGCCWERGGEGLVPSAETVRVLGTAIDHFAVT